MHVHSFMQTSTNENIYMIPGRDEDTLYAQLQEILTDNVTRDTVESVLGIVLHVYLCMYI